MKPSQWSRAVLALLLSLWFATGHKEAGAQPSGGTSGGAKRALLIGINKYRAVPKLRGSLNDIETMKQVLITRWGFPEGNIRFLTDEQATRQGILAALHQFVSETGPQDTVYVHYSGHGSQVQDLNGDEPDDKLDETLVPQDGRTGSVPDITDDELDAIFSRLPTTHAFIVLDSCHSGTATRSVDIRTRSVPQDTRIALYRHIAEGQVRTRGNVQLLRSHYVLMTGAASHQEALDGPVDGRYHGFFTYALSKSLSSSSPTASSREVLAGVEREFKRIQTHFGRSSMPEPQLEAPAELLDKPLLGSAGDSLQAQNAGARPRLAWLEVKQGDSGTVTLFNGLLLGATPGSSWGIYPPDDTTFAPGRALAIATVTQLTGQDAKATVHPSGKKIPEHSRAVALIPASLGEKIPIHILDVPDARRKRIEEVLLKHIPQVELVGSEQTPRYLIHSQGSEIRLLTADGLQLVASFRNDGDAWGASLALVVSRSANAAELLALDNPSSQLKIDVRVVNAVAPKPSVSTRGIKVVGDTQAAKYRIRREGRPRTAQNSLQLEIRSSADSYITIVDVDSEGGVNLLFPNAHQKRNFYNDGFVRGGEAVLIPDSIAPGNKAGFYWDYSPPKGTDTIRVFSSTDLQTAQMIRERVQALQGSAAGLKTRSIASVLRTLRESLATLAARGIITVPDPTSHLPSEVSPAPPNQPAEMPPLSTTIEGTGNAQAPSVNPEKPERTGAEVAFAPAAAPTADWTATSVTVTISD